MKITDYLFSSYVEGFLPEYSRKDMSQVSVMLENEVIKKKKRDHRTVNAIFIKVSKKPGVQIFVLEPTKRDLARSNFTLDKDTKLTIHTGGWVYESFKIVIPQKPSHPIVYAKLIRYNIIPDPVTISFDLNRRRKRSFAAIGKNHVFQVRPNFDEDACILFDESDYKVGEVWDPDSTRKRIPVHMKDMGGFRRLISSSYILGDEYADDNVDTSGFSQVSKIGLLETAHYFYQFRTELKAGFHFFDEIYEYEILDVDYFNHPRYPLLIIGRLDHKLKAA